MTDDSNDIDEVALNVLLAEGLDVPTAWEASRRDTGRESVALGCIGTVILVVVSALVIAVLVL